MAKIIYKALNCILITVSVLAGANASAQNNYYNMLLDDEAAVKYRHGEDYLSDYHYNFFNAKDCVADVLNFPLFKGFARLMMPDTLDEHEHIHLDELQNIMPYHRNVTVTHTLESLEYFAQSASEGNQIFYPVYSKTQISEDRALADVGLFFIRGHKNAPFAIVVPGGYRYRSLIHEGFPVGLRIAKKGYNVFVLSYRQKNVLKGSADLVNAINMVLDRAKELKVSKEDFSLWGASVGAQLVINVVHTSEKKISGGMLKGKPAADILTYPISFYGNQEDPPTYVVVGEKDMIVNKTVLKSSVANLNNLKIRSDYIEMPRLEHGFGVGIDPDSSVSINWIGRAVSFWEENSSIAE
ncbi:MAG: alpha/beta hydrolase [Succinivibrio sp.]